MWPSQACGTGGGAEKDGEAQGGMWRKTVREKGHLSQTVVMAASSEQANAWRPGREEAVKAMGLVRGMVSSVMQAPSWGP